MVCDGSKSFKIAAKCPIISHRVAGPIHNNLYINSLSGGQELSKVTAGRTWPHKASTLSVARWSARVSPTLTNTSGIPRAAARAANLYPEYTYGRKVKTSFSRNQYMI